MLSSTLTLLVVLPLIQEPRAQADPAPGRISGRVVGPLATPIGKARVELYASGASEATRVVETRSSGWFRIAGLPLGRYQLRVTAAQHTVARSFATLTEERPTRTGTTFRLWAATRVSGKVVTSAGKPVAGALVVATNDRSRVLSSFRVDEVETDQEGRFVFEHAPMGELRVRGFRAGLDLVHRDVFVRKPTEVDLVLTSGKGAALELTVTGLSKAELAACTVLLGEFLHGSRQAYPKSVRSPSVDKDGKVRWTGLPAGEFSLSVRHPELSFRQPSRISLASGGAKSVVVGVIRSAKNAAVSKAARVSGTLVDTAGQPLAGKTIVLRANSVGRLRVTSQEGGKFEFRFSKQPNELVNFSLVGDALALDSDTDRTFRIGINSDASGLRLVAHRTATIRGTVILASGPPARGVFVRLTGEHPHNVWPRRTYRRGARTARDGSFTISRIVSRENEDLWLEVADLDGATVHKGIRVQPGQVKRDVRLLLEEPAEVSGTVRDAKGRPVTGARVWLRTWDLAKGSQRDGSVTEVLADANGRYRHVGVQPGGYYVSVHFGAERGLPATKCDPFELHRAERKTVDLSIEGPKRGP